MSRAVDSMITRCLVEFNKVQSRFLGAVIDQSRLVLEDQNKKQLLRDSSIKAQVEKVDLLLKGQRHDPELSYIYVFLSIGLGLQFLGFFLVHFLKNRMVNWILLNQGPGWVPGRPYSELTVPQPCQPCSNQGCCTPLLERPRP